MNILLISWYFPPVNDVAALRTGAFADFLSGRGHEVFVLTAARQAADVSLQVPLHDSKITRTRWFDVDRWQIHQALQGAAKPPVRPSLSSTSKPFRLVRLRRWASKLYTDLIHVPDRQVGWYPFAVSAGRQLAKKNAFDLIYASGPSFVSFLIADRLSRISGIPWIAEYRDCWSGDIYRGRARWREQIDRFVEGRTLRSCCGVIAVSEPWADYFRTRFAKPTAAIYNGYDVEVSSDRPSYAPDKPVVISYFGQLYEGLRDPTPLYLAIKQSDLTPNDVQVHYYGPKEEHVRPLADQLGVSEHVLVRGHVTHAQSLQIQRQSDVLLLLQAPDDPRNVPAKVFEYFATGRPILGLGLDLGIPASLVRQRHAGVYVSDPLAIAQHLRWLVEEKRKTGMIADVPDSARAGLSREAQLSKLEKFLFEQHRRVSA